MTQTQDQIDWNAMWEPQELCEELAERVRDAGMFKSISHPLIVSAPYFEAENRRLNMQLEAKRAKLEEFRAGKKWHSWVFLHERPYRIDALMQLVGEGVLSNKAKWNLIAECWTDSENIWQCWDEWRELWSSPGYKPEYVMTAREIAALAGMPEEFDVWRGVNRGRMDTGFSWTTNRDKAAWFSRRYSGAQPDRKPVVLHGRVRRSDVLGLFFGRNESEVVAIPDDVAVIGSETA